MYGTSDIAAWGTSAYRCGERRTYCTSTYTTGRGRVQGRRTGIIHMWRWGPEQSDAELYPGWVCYFHSRKNIRERRAHRTTLGLLPWVNYVTMHVRHQVHRSLWDREWWPSRAVSRIVSLRGPSFLQDSMILACAYWSIRETAQLNRMVRIGQVCSSRWPVPFKKQVKHINGLLLGAEISGLIGFLIDGKRERAISSGSDRNYHILATPP